LAGSPAADWARHPVALTQLSTMLLWTIDLLMVGRIDVLSFNAVSLGRIWVMGTTICAMGLIFGLDAIASQAHGARDRERLGEVLLHAGVLALAVSVPLGALWLGTEKILLVLGQDRATVALAHRFVVVQMPGLPFFLLFVVLKQYLQARGIVRPAMWVSFAACGFNACLNWLFGLRPLGPAADGGSRGRSGDCDHRSDDAARSARRDPAVPSAARRDDRVRSHRLRVKGLSEILRLGFPLAVMLALEYWAFAISTLWPGGSGRSTSRRIRSRSTWPRSLTWCRSASAWERPPGWET